MTTMDSQETTPLLRSAGGDVESQEQDEMAQHSRSLLNHLSEKNAKNEKVDIDNDVMNYRATALTTWKAFHIGANSVWRSYALWSMMGKLGLVALTVATLTFVLVPDPAALQVGKFSQVSKFLNIIIGLMMGFFLTSSTKRWHSCIEGFLQLLDAIRNLQMQFKALGVPKERSLVINRYGLASAWLLYGSLLTQWQRFTPSDRNLMQEAWEHFRTHRVNLDGVGPIRLFEDSEIKTLRSMRDPPGMMWMWIANLVGKLSQDGLIPPMQTPTYGRIMDLCQNGHGGIRSVRAAICVQAPLPYTHTLAILVHINCFLNAITLGLVCGCTVGTILTRAQMHIHSAKASGVEVSQDMQMLGLTFVYSFFDSLMYLGLLSIGFHLAQPFDHEDTSVPLDLFLHRLEADLKDGNELMNRIPKFMPGFKMPHFKA